MCDRCTKWPVLAAHAAHILHVPSKQGTCECAHHRLHILITGGSHSPCVCVTLSENLVLTFCVRFACAEHAREYHSLFTQVISF